MANNCCGKRDPTVTDNELVWKAIEYAEVKKCTVGCVFPMVIRPEFRMGQYKVFIIKTTTIEETHPTFYIFLGKIYGFYSDVWISRTWRRLWL